MTDPEFPDSRHALDPGCERCPALVESRECIAWGTGPTDASVMVVGEAPGGGRRATLDGDGERRGAASGNSDADTWRGGNWTGRAYTTRHSGRRVRRLLATLGYGDDCYFTNAVKCFPAAEDGSNREPTDSELANCRTHLRAEVERVDPAVVVTTGKHATRSVLAFDDRTLDGFLDAVLEPTHSDALDVALLPVLHPSYRDVWASRLGYANEEYVAAVGERLDALVEG